MYIFSTEFFRFGEMCTLQGAFWFNNEMVPFCNSWNDHCKNAVVCVWRTYCRYQI